MAVDEVGQRRVVEAGPERGLHLGEQLGLGARHGAPLRAGLDPAVAVTAAGTGLLGEQQRKGQVVERPVGADQQVLALDQMRGGGDQGLVEGVAVGVGAEAVEDGHAQLAHLLLDLLAGRQLEDLEVVLEDAEEEAAAVGKDVLEQSGVLVEQSILDVGRVHAVSWVKAA